MLDNILPRWICTGDKAIFDRMLKQSFEEGLIKDQSERSSQDLLRLIYYDLPLETSIPVHLPLLIDIPQWTNDTFCSPARRILIRLNLATRSVRALTINDDPVGFDSMLSRAFAGLIDLPVSRNTCGAALSHRLTTSCLQCALHDLCAEALDFKFKTSDEVETGLIEIREAFYEMTAEQRQVKPLPEVVALYLDRPETLAVRISEAYISSQDLQEACAEVSAEDESMGVFYGFSLETEALAILHGYLERNKTKFINLGGTTSKTVPCEFLRQYTMASLVSRLILDQQ